MYIYDCRNCYSLRKMLYTSSDKINLLKTTSYYTINSKQNQKGH